MNNSNNLSDTLLSNDFPSMTTNLDNSLSPSSTSNGFFSFLSNITFTTWIIIILILAFLGFNVFVYLAKGTQEATNYFAPLIKAIFGSSVAVSSNIIDVSAEGGKAVVGTSSDIIQSGLSEVQKITPNQVKIPGNNPEQIKDDKLKHEIIQQSSLNKALNSAESQTNAQQNTNYESDYASSSIQGGGKAGWCFIGIDKGFRTCAEVGVNDTCMSGQIFPSNEICMNPSLRP